MRKFMLIFALTFLLMLSMNISAVADEGMNVEISKVVNSDTESYGIEFEINDDSESGFFVKNVQWILINVPNGNKMWLSNTFRLNQIGLVASGMSYKNFKRRFPEGKYSIILFPKKYGKLIENITHDFPPTPVINSPVDGATDVPLPLTIEFERTDGFYEFRIDTEGPPDMHIETLLGPGNSYTFWDGAILPNTYYELCLHARIDKANTLRCIHFTTGN